MSPSTPLDLLTYRTLQYAYRILGLGISATPSEVRDAYKSLAIIVHPDKVAACDREHATAEFQKLKAAYDICFPHATSVAASKSKHATFEDDPDSDSAAQPENIWNDEDEVFFFFEEDVLDVNDPVHAAARKREKLYGGMAEEEPNPERLDWRGRRANSQARWTAEQRLAQHRKAYVANGRLEGGVKGLTAGQRLKVKRAKEKRAGLEEAAGEERAESGVGKVIKQVQRKAQQEGTKKEVKRLDEVPECWEDEMEDEDENAEGV
ncbi:hypothetical protein P171DRAFT_480333 [Karstenula rhodostoma CBS 690.94]|uniref:J domain-containing protein n=1 Tax=Karstenula rhodostoma CBS 690.94 TaxID=1392251 RepID=A0A9P4PQ30_9PLEO|nr:hypothetical protein P171DRAFT_480333 [Karstenula rhodostoma CBS 690.94]